LLFVDWDHKYTTFLPAEIRDMPGGQPATIDQLFLPPDFEVRLTARIPPPNEMHALQTTGFSFLPTSEPHLNHFTDRAKPLRFMCASDRAPHRGRGGRQ
jgi:hypothetical protein